MQEVYCRLCLAHGEMSDFPAICPIAIPPVQVKQMRITRIKVIRRCGLEFALEVVGQARQLRTPVRRRKKHNLFYTLEKLFCSPRTNASPSAVRTSCLMTRPPRLCPTKNNGPSCAPAFRASDRKYPTFPGRNAETAPAASIYARSNRRNRPRHLSPLL